jgi:hypothetical protein
LSMYEIVRAFSPLPTGLIAEASRISALALK